jgi:hypothetical protein
VTVAAGPAAEADGRRDPPPDLRGWNWGAFLLTWIWGVGNATYLSFLVFVPVAGILVMPFVLGAKGDEWAWRNGTWRSVGHFRRVQRRWAIGGAVFWVATAVLAVLPILGVQLVLTSSEPYRLGMEAIAADARVADRLGRPIGGGTAQGSVEVSGGDGRADLTFPVTGPGGGGRAALTARRTLGAWTITALGVRIERGSDVIDVVPATGSP